MTRDDVEARYRSYIDCLNAHRVHDLEPFVHEEVIYNGTAMTRFEYQNLIATGLAALPDLFFDIQILLVDGDRIACRIGFDCTLRGEFLGLKAAGSPVSFSEHVFYRLRDGKIAEVSSLIDRPAIEAQLAGDRQHRPAEPDRNQRG